MNWVGEGWNSNLGKRHGFGEEGKDGLKNDIFRPGGGFAVTDRTQRLLNSTWEQGFWGFRYAVIISQAEPTNGTLPNTHVSFRRK